MIETPEHIEKKTLGSACAYRTSCGCGCENQITMELTDESNYGILSLDFTAHKCSWYDGHGFWSRLWNRISVAWQYLRTGEMELSESLILNSSAQVRDIGKLFLGMADEMESKPLLKRLELLAEVGIILEALNAATIWELPESTKKSIEEVLPFLREKLKGLSTGNSVALWDELDNIFQSIKINRFVAPEIRGRVTKLLPAVRRHSNKRAF